MVQHKMGNQIVTIIGYGELENEQTRKEHMIRKR